MVACAPAGASKRKLLFRRGLHGSRIVAVCIPAAAVAFLTYCNVATHFVGGAVSSPTSRAQPRAVVTATRQEPLQVSGTSPERPRRGILACAFGACAAALAPLLLAFSRSRAAIAAIEDYPSLQYETRSTSSLQESAGLAGQSNKDVALYADLGDGLKATNLSTVKVDDNNPDASRPVQVGDRVTVDLIGYLAGYNGLVFVRTQDKSGFSEKPLTFKVGAGDVIQGLDRGVVGMRKGEKRRLVIPAKLGYPRPLKDEDFGKPGTLPNPSDSADGSGAPWELRNRLLNGVINNSQRDDTLVMDVKLVRIS